MVSEDSVSQAVLPTVNNTVEQSLPRYREFQINASELLSDRFGPNNSLLRRETSENVVASVVDVASILFAYRLGMDHFGIAAALGYALFDAYLVIWQRKRFNNWIHKFISFIS